MKGKIIYEVKRHLSDATAIMTIANPVYSFIETQFAGMSDPVSIKSRILNTGLVYGGLASLAKLRDASLKLFGLDKNSRNLSRLIHDIAFAGTFVLGIKPVVYLVSGETDWKKIAIGTGGGMLATGLTSGAVGYLMDTYREIFGLKEEQRMHEILRRQKPRVKKAVVAGLVALSLAVTTSVYTFLPNKNQENYQQPQQLIMKQSPERIQQPGILEQISED